MTVAELIKELQAYSPDATIVSSDGMAFDTPMALVVDEWEHEDTGRRVVEIAIVPDTTGGNHCIVNDGE
jgi:hypothetical protein